MITKTEYEALKEQNSQASRNNDYSKMIMMGDPNDLKMKEYERESLCSHPSIQTFGSTDRCSICGKEWF